MPASAANILHSLFEEYEKSVVVPPALRIPFEAALSKTVLDKEIPAPWILQRLGDVIVARAPPLLCTPCSSK